MKGLKKLVDGWEKHFHKGGKYAKYYPLFEAFYTFLFMPSTRTQNGPHVRDALDTKRYMSVVIFSLKPALAFGIYNVGYQAQLAIGGVTDLLTCILVGAKAVLPILVVSYVVGLGIEFLFAIIRGHEINEGYLVTGMLIALIMPPTIPLWMVAMGVAFGVIIGKEVFGGSGRNFLNPALTARAFLFFTYPAYMSGDTVWTYFGTAKEQVVDTFSGATPLAVAALASKGTDVHASLQAAGYTLEKLFWGMVPGSIGETSVFCILLGAGLLLITKIGSWRTMLGSLIGAVMMTLIFNTLAGPDNSAFLHLTPVWHLFMGSFAFATVFMATDPVSSPHLDQSKFVYGFLIGVMGIIIRVANPAYPEGWMLAILLLNVFAPLIDHVVLQRQLKKRIPNEL